MHRSQCSVQNSKLRNSTSNGQQSGVFSYGTEDTQQYPLSEYNIGYNDPLSDAGDDLVRLMSVQESTQTGKDSRE